ncbi:related to Endoglucanase 1 precursor [Moesziomyces antarcticus]|uniref:cellulase n=2 Tax=Pseudozyma antarctica TaxID=84753 RepID=A0A5C3FN75_PSEA2|nr:related to Endoglucanase 1 precursor [Moesziomyces antarcticus]
MAFTMQKSTMLIAFVDAAIMAVWTPLVAANAATMYYDCCKPSSSWPGKANPVYNPVAVCLADGKTVVTGPRLNDATSSGCGGGDQFQCSCQQPWTDHANPELGYAFAAMTTQTESENACACYVLDFAGARPGKVKTLFYQVINTGADVGGGGLDILVPGMGIGLMTQGCPAQFKTDISVWGKQYGGLDHDAAGCHKLPADLQHGCLWRMNEWGDSVNMAGQPRRVKCSQAHIDRTGCQRTDEKNVPSFEQAFASIRHGGDAHAAPDRYTPNAAVCGIGHSGHPMARRNYVGAHSNSISRSSSHSSSSHHIVVQKQTSGKGHHPGKGHHAGKGHHRAGEHH